MGGVLLSVFGLFLSLTLLNMLNNKHWHLCMFLANIEILIFVGGTIHYIHLRLFHLLYGAWNCLWYTCSLTLFSWAILLIACAKWWSRCLNFFFCLVSLSLHHADRLVSYLWSVAEHDKMTKGNQIRSLGNVNYKMKRELTEYTGNKSQNIYMQRETGGQPCGAI